MGGRCVVLAVSLVIASCSSDADSDRSTDSVADPTAITSITTSTADPTPATTTATTTTETTTTETTEPRTISTTATTQPAATTSLVCTFDGGVDAVMHDFPFQMSGEVGADIRTGAHPCYERIVIELGAGDTQLEPVIPGYWVRYADGPVTLGQSDDQFVELAGNADLLITVNAWMTTFDGEGELSGYTGPTDIAPTNVEAILQLRLVDNFEGVHTWAIGLDVQRPFRVSTLADPTRIVVDVAAS